MVSYIRPSSEGGRTYTTTETWTGDYWIDGRKIYRKVFVLYPLKDITASVWITYKLDVDHLDKVFFESMTLNYDGYVAPVPSIFPDGMVNHTTAMRVNIRNSELQFRSQGNSSWAGVTLIAVLKYTCTDR